MVMWECNWFSLVCVYFIWVLEYLVYQLHEDDAIALALVRGLINFTIVYVVCVFVV